MAAPLKPWEKAKLSNNLRVNSPSLAPNPSLPPGHSFTKQPPGPPPRPSRTSVNSRLPSVYSGGYGGYGYGSLGGYGGYGTGMYGSSLYGSGMYGGMNRFGGGYDGVPTNSFARLAEESSRPAFQSIESIVQAFGSVAMMLESTYGAVYNSFRAVLGVADNFSNLRAHFTQVFSALAIVKTLRYLYRKLLVLLRLRDAGLEEDTWLSAMDTVSESSLSEPKKTKSSWPILLFLAVVFGGPYLIWKMLSSITPREDRNWASGEDDHFVALAEYDFDGESEDELSFRAGQKIRIAPKDLQPRMRGWLLACVDGKKTGIIPANYIKLLGKRQGSKSLAQTPAGSMQPAGESSRTDNVSSVPSRDSFAEFGEIFEGENASGRHVHFEEEQCESAGVNEAAKCWEESNENVSLPQELSNATRQEK